MKKLLALCLAVICLISFTACGNQQSGTETSNEEQSGTNTGKGNTVGASGDTNLSWEEIKKQIPEELKGTTVKVFSWNDANAATGSVQAIKQFEKETGIKVEWEVGTYDDYITKVAAKVAGDESPDIVRLRDADVSLIKLLTPLDEIDYDFTDQAWNQKLMYEYTINGKQYAAIMNNTPYFQPMVMYYNRNLIAKYNLEDPYELWKNGEWTWNKCMELCQTFLDQAGTNYSGLSLLDGCDYAHCMNTSFLSYEPENNQYVSHMSEPALVRAWQFVSKNVANGLISNTIYDYKNFEAGTVLFCNNALIGARTTHFFFVDMKANGELGTVPIPALDGQKEYYQELVENEAYGIPKGAKNPEAAAYFLRYYLDQEHYNMDGFYCDEQAAEVAEWCKKQQFTTNVERIIYEDQYGTNRLHMSYKLRQTEPAQVKTALDTYVSVIDKVVSDGNKAIEELE